MHQRAQTVHEVILISHSFLIIIFYHKMVI